MQVFYRISKRGVPHSVVVVQGRSFSVCWMGKRKLYRIWDWVTQEKLLDVPMEEGGSFEIESTIKRFLLNT